MVDKWHHRGPYIGFLGESARTQSASWIHCIHYLSCFVPSQCSGGLLVPISISHHRRHTHHSHALGLVSKWHKHACFWILGNRSTCKKSTGRTCKLHTERLWPELNPNPSSCELTVLTTNLLTPDPGKLWDLHRGVVSRTPVVPTKSISVYWMNGSNSQKARPLVKHIDLVPTW